MPQIGLVVLSSISEALHHWSFWKAMLRAPTVTTDVGSCRQLVYGLDEEDQAPGPHVGRGGGDCRPQALAEAAQRLLGDEGPPGTAPRAGITRVGALLHPPVMFCAIARV